MATQKHLLKRQLIELTMDDAAAAPGISDQISAAYRQAVLPLLEQACNQLAAPERVYRIDTLVLDLGELALPNLAQQFIDKIKDALYPALAKALASQQLGALAPGQTGAPASGTGSGSSTGPDNGAEPSALELFASFVSCGVLPWWAEHGKSGLLSDNLQQLIEHSRAAFSALLQALACDAKVRQRIAIHYDDGQLAQMCALMLPAWGSELTMQVAAQLAALQGVAQQWAAHELRPCLWRNCFEVAAQGGAQYATAEAFFQAVLARVANELGLRSGELPECLASTPAQVSGANMPAALSATASQANTRLAQLRHSDAANPLWACLQTLLADCSAPLQAQLQQLPSDSTQAAVAVQKLLMHWPAEPGLRADQLTQLQQLLATVSDPAHAPSQASRAANRAPGLFAALSAPSLAVPLLSALGPAAPPAHQQQQQQPPGAGKTGPLWACLQGLMPHFSATFRAQLQQVPSGDARAVALALRQLLAQHRSEHDLRPDQLNRLQHLLRSELASQPSSNAAPEAAAHANAARAARLRRVALPEQLNLDNAGMVILWPFLPQFFRQLGLLHERDFSDMAARQRAIGLLQILAAGPGEMPEYRLPLNKLLCGLELAEPFDFGPPLAEAEAEQCEQLLLAVIAQAPILNQMSPDGLRGSFLLRPGVLSEQGGHYLLRVERQSFDVVLERFGWSWSWIKHPWMNAPLRVEW